MGGKAQPAGGIYGPNRAQALAMFPVGWREILGYAAGGHGGLMRVCLIALSLLMAHVPQAKAADEQSEQSDGSGNSEESEESDTDSNPKQVR